MSFVVLPVFVQSLYKEHVMAEIQLALCNAPLIVTLADNKLSRLISANIPPKQNVMTKMFMVWPC